MRRIIFSAISILCLFITFIMFGFDSTKWYGSFIKLLYDVTMFMPFILGGLGIISAIFGIKGDYRMVLVVLHSFILLLYLGIYIKIFYGIM